MQIVKALLYIKPQQGFYSVSHIFTVISEDTVQCFLLVNESQWE